MTVIKARSRRHPTDLLRYEITERGIVGGERFNEYQGIITGVAQRRSNAGRLPNSLSRKPSYSTLCWRCAKAAIPSWPNELASSTRWSRARCGAGYPSLRKGTPKDCEELVGMAGFEPATP
jgi:hypothetical protein